MTGLRRLERGVRFGAPALFVLLAAGCSSPWQGPGALYLHHKGKHVCMEVDSVHFIGSRFTIYTVNGQFFSTEVTPEYYAGSKCG
jgi:hypothetical protein